MSSDRADRFNSIKMVSVGVYEIDGRGRNLSLFEQSNSGFDWVELGTARAVRRVILKNVSISFDVKHPSDIGCFSWFGSIGASVQFVNCSIGGQIVKDEILLAHQVVNKATQLSLSTQ